MAIYAVDFDGTLAVTRFPEIVEPKRKVVAAVKMLKANGHKVILWTSRAGRDLEAAVEWCHGQGLEFDAVNEPLPEQVARWGNDTRKVYADFYIDDKAMSVIVTSGMVIAGARQAERPIRNSAESITT